MNQCLRSDIGSITEIYKGEVMEEEVHWNLESLQINKIMLTLPISAVK